MSTKKIKAVIKKPLRAFLRLLLLLLAFSLTPARADTLLRVTPQQAGGITFTSLARAHELVSAKFLAEVVVPTGQARVLSAPQAGLVERLNVTTGSVVKAGDVLAVLNSPQLLSLQREYFQALSQQRLAQRNASRDGELFHEGIIAERRYLESQSIANEALALSRERKQALLLAGSSAGAMAQLETSGEYSPRLQLHAPISSVVVEQSVALGQRVEASTPLYRIAALNPLWLELSVPVELSQSLKMGMAVRVQGQKGQGKIIAILPAVSKGNQALLVRAEIAQSQPILRPGQWLEAHIVLETVAKNVWRVARRALVNNQQTDYLFVQVAGGFVAKPVKMLSREHDRLSPDSVLIESADLSGKEKIVLDGAATLKAQLRGGQ